MLHYNGPGRVVRDPTLKTFVADALVASLIIIRITIDRVFKVLRLNYNIIHIVLE